MKITIELAGLKETRSALAELPRATARNVVERVLKKRSEPMIIAAASAAPVGDTGKLQDSIGISKKLTKSQKNQYPKQSDVEFYIGPSAHPKGQQQEFGNINHGPQPFLRPAFDAHAMGMLNGILADFWNEIKAAADRLARKALRAAAKGKK